MAEIILIGSSIFEQWYNFSKAFCNTSVKNCAIGGTKTADWQGDRLKPILHRECPRYVMAYVGSNDMYEVSENVIMKNMIAIREVIYDYNPLVKFAYFSVIKAPDKRKIRDKIERVNKFAAENLYGGDLFYDSNRIFFDRGRLREDLFLEDGLHHPHKTYDALVVDVKPFLKDWMGDK